MNHLRTVIKAISAWVPADDPKPQEPQPLRQAVAVQAWQERVAARRTDMMIATLRLFPDRPAMSGKDLAALTGRDVTTMDRCELDVLEPVEDLLGLLVRTHPKAARLPHLTWSIGQWPEAGTLSGQASLGYHDNPAAVVGAWVRAFHLEPTIIDEADLVMVESEGILDGRSIRVWAMVWMPDYGVPRPDPGEVAAAIRLNNPRQERHS